MSAIPHYTITWQGREWDVEDRRELNDSLPFSLNAQPSFVMRDPTVKARYECFEGQFPTETVTRLVDEAIRQQAEEE